MPFLLLTTSIVEARVGLEGDASTLKFCKENVSSECDIK